VVILNFKNLIFIKKKRKKKEKSSFFNIIKTNVVDYLNINIFDL